MTKYKSEDMIGKTNINTNGSVYMIFRLISALFRSGIRHALKRDKSTKRAREYSNIFDFVFTFSVGIEYILLIYAFTYNSESKGTREIGLIALAFAFSLKLYPVIFGWILIRDKRFKDAIRCAIYGIAMIVLPAFAFGGFKVFGQVLDNIMRFSSSDDKSNIFSHVLGFFNLEHINVDFMTPVMWLWAATVCLCFVISPFVTKDTWRTYAVGALAIICIPSLTSLYAWSFTLAPIIMICNKKELSRKTWFYCVFMMIPFIMIPLRFHYAISNNGFVLYFCAAILSIVAVADTIKDLVLTIKANRSEGITLKQYFKSLVTVDKAS